jgi:cobalt-zinc-cadmium efflux system membrane fusion protein
VPSCWPANLAQPRKRITVRENEAPTVHIGQPIYFTTLAYPERDFPANTSYVATALDPITWRLVVRATVQNSVGLLKPEMYASMKILTGEGDATLAVPRDAIIYEGDATRAWAVRDDSKALELRRVKVGQTSGKMIEVMEGLAPNDRAITKGTLFIDGWRRRAARP